jgi:hypothetical protein
MIVCPYCKGKISDEPELPRLSARMARIYRAVAAAGEKGISPSDLLVRMYADEEWPTPAGAGIMRVQIHEINKRIQSINQHITNWHRGNYRLVQIKEEVQQADDPQAGHSHQEEQ